MSLDPTDTRPQTLYRMYSRVGALLYVGVSVRPTVRFEEHAGDKPWWPEVDIIKVEHYDTRVAVEIAEIHAIQEEKPKYNVAFSSAAFAPPEVRKRPMPRAVPTRDKPTLPSRTDSPARPGVELDVETQKFAGKLGKILNFIGENEPVSRMRFLHHFRHTIELSPRELDDQLSFLVESGRLHLSRTKDGSVYSISEKAEKS